MDECHVYIPITIGNHPSILDTLLFMQVKSAKASKQSIGTVKMVTNQSRVTGSDQTSRKLDYLNTDPHSKKG